MKVGLDATPLLGPRTGVGHYVTCLVRALADLGPEESDLEEVALVPFSWRGTRDLPAEAPRGPRIRFGQRRVPARLLRAAWERTPWPPVEWFAGRVDVFHATNFVAPPARRAGLVVTVHDLSYLRYPEMVSEASARYRELVPLGIVRGAVVCTPTAAVAAEVAETYRVPAERLVVTPLGVGTEWFEAEPPDGPWLAERGLPARYLLFVGSREPRKNLQILQAAYRALPADRPSLVLAGPPGWGEALDLRGVITPGYLPDEDLVRVVAGATGGQADLVDPGDADGLAAALAKVLAEGDGGTAARAARRARAATFTWEATARATLGAYRLAAGAGGGRP